MSNEIAPHEGREFELVLRGEKPLALVEREKDPEQYDTIIDTWLVGSKPPFSLTFIEPDSVLIALTEEPINSYQSLVKGWIKTKDRADYQTRMGKLFGYTDEQIEAFINEDIKCNCTSCNGVSYTGENPSPSRQHANASGEGSKVDGW